MSDSVGKEMPRYKCHKIVHALKIAKLETTASLHEESDGSLWLTPAERDFARIKIERDYVRKHAPHAGGYYVVYEDGYRSFSPAAAFEGGYTLVEPYEAGSQGSDEHAG